MRSVSEREKGRKGERKRVSLLSGGSRKRDDSIIAKVLKTPSGRL